MNRRNFLKRALIGAGAAVVASKIPLKLLTSPATSAETTINGYANYCNFSSVAVAESIDKAVQESAIELGYRASQSISELYAATFDSI